MLKTILVASTPEPLAVIASAAKLCYSAGEPETVVSCVKASLKDEEKRAKILGLIDDIYQSGHMSPFEHVSYTFGVSGLSRVTSHQLVRHRVASFSQQSQRYVKQSNAEFVLPPSIKENNCEALFEVQTEECIKAYNEMVSKGVPAEDARFILPHGAYTNIIFTMNARELLHFFKLRLCKRAQWEIRELGEQMLELVYPTAPEIFKHAGPPCKEGECPEPVGRRCLK